jgi:hypothetical protein
MMITSGQEVVPGHVMKAYWEWKYRAPSFLILAQIELSGQLHAPAELLRRKSPRYSLNRRLVSLRAGLDALEKI